MKLNENDERPPHSVRILQHYRMLAQELGPQEAYRRLEAGIVGTLLNQIIPDAKPPLPGPAADLPPDIVVSTETLSSLYQHYLNDKLKQSGGRRRQGSFYTPSVLVNVVLDRLYFIKAKSLDFSCGCGAFLSETLRRLLDAGVPPLDALAVLHGGDLDSHAVKLCRIRLALESLAVVRNPTEQDWHRLLELAERQIQVGEALLELEWDTDFDLVIGNPPFLSAKEMARAGMGDYRKQLSERFRSARGAFDLAVVFVERGLELLRPGGRLGLVLPHKLFAADYGQSLRKLLAEGCSSFEILDHSRESHFTGARVYPQVLSAEKSAAACQQVSVAPSPISHQPSAIIHSIEEHSVALDSLCRIQVGTAGFQAARTADKLVDGSGDWPFIVTGSIDRYRIHGKPVRYQHQRYEQPFLVDDPEIISNKRRTLFSSPKIVVAGMVRRLEAAFDSTGYAMGVNLYGLTEWQVDPRFLLAVINSAAASFYFRERFADKHLASDFYAINKGTLARLPIPKASDELIKKLSDLAQNWTPAADNEIDDLLFDFYGFSKEARQHIHTRLPPLQPGLFINRGAHRQQAVRCSN